MQYFANSEMRNNNKSQRVKLSYNPLKAFDKNTIQTSAAVEAIAENRTEEPLSVRIQNGDHDGN